MCCTHTVLRHPQGARTHIKAGRAAGGEGRRAPVSRPPFRLVHPDTPLRGAYHYAFSVDRVARGLILFFTVLPITAISASLETRPWFGADIGSTTQILLRELCSEIRNTRKHVKEDERWWNVRWVKKLK
ncbi:hypothetical protein C8R44DRAFT_730348 [Mycena epipterygia]|nr:hypothetical protein C8R44DRAFT_730348 [Mycena epipterygia]